MTRLVSRPAHSSASIVDMTMNLYTYPVVLIAHHLKFFEYIALKPRSINDICGRMALHSRPVEAIMATLRALNLVHLEGESYTLTAQTEEYLLPESPHYFGCFWDLMYENSDNFSVKHLEQAISKNHAQVYDEVDIFEAHVERAEMARTFTHAMHSLSMGTASVWATQSFLEQHREVLDIGGGSGAHAISVAANWPQIKSTIFDLAEICPLTEEYIQQYQLSGRVNTYAGDMWKDNYPPADLHIYSNIFHDWTDEKNRFLAEKSFTALPSGGRIVIHEVLYHDETPGPLAAAALSLVMLGWTEGRQYSGQQISEILTQAGFGNIEIMPSNGHYSIVVGQKI